MVRVLGEPCLVPELTHKLTEKLYDEMAYSELINNAISFWEIISSESPSKTVASTGNRGSLDCWSLGSHILVPVAW